MQREGGVSVLFEWNPNIFELGAHDIFQNPRTTHSSRKVTAEEEEEEREKECHSLWVLFRHSLLRLFYKHLIIP